MGVDFALGCLRCASVLSLHKWPVVRHAGDVLVHAHYPRGQYPAPPRPAGGKDWQLVDLDTRAKKILVSSEDLLAGIAARPDQPYIHDLVPHVDAFARAHEGHQTFLSCDLGDVEEDPWWPGREGWERWTEVPAVFHERRYLPRNLVEHEGLRSWDDVLRTMGSEWPFAYPTVWPTEIELIRVAFERLLNHAAPIG